MPRLAAAAQASLLSPVADWYRHACPSACPGNPALGMLEEFLRIRSNQHITVSQPAHRSAGVTFHAGPGSCGRRRGDRVRRHPPLTRAEVWECKGFELPAPGPLERRFTSESSVGRGTFVGAPDLDDRRRIRRGRRRYLLLVVGATVAFGALLGACAGLGWYDMTWEREPPRWADVLGMVLACTGLVSFFGVLIYGLRTKQFRANRNSPLWALSWSRRREVMRQVRRGGEVADEELPLLRHTAERLAAQRALLGLLASQVIMFAGQGLMRWSPTLLIVYVPLFAVAAPLIVRDVRRAEEFLRTHPALDEDASSTPGRA